ncbi:formimidoylglutamate deiminase [Roseisalinus antarcticus]|uniref:8-oxoguanine deaminase n=1 Tax=Roseisalinus antarcticus TaxID=254357 RepID=A0A1Y5RDU5_9RHOB|nr:formimidoylglutamate deiminase [Roseisalinus antarcticus]SLN15093.1 8-oxoguanine deaminase [Roseisalinus antarcticus]
MIFADRALTPAGWATDVRLTLAGDRIDDLRPDTQPEPGDIRVAALLPGMANVHSHAFQRGFAGLTEARGLAQDSFWTWRDMMYRFALTIDPDGMQALAEMAYVEMLEAGYVRVGEFHYLHHDPDGGAYADPAEMSGRIFAAAAETGIALTHLPVFYAHGGFGPQPATPGQRRFVHDLAGFAELVKRCDAMAVRPQDRVGYAPHSLRAATSADLNALAEALPGRPVHIHIAEQQREVEECLAVLGQRPVAWLFENAEVTEAWCLIHATHMVAPEISALAASGAVAGLCPVTEANLGDGLFRAEAYLGRGGAIAIGTDSNVRVDLAGELRLLEYGQRLAHHRRNVLAPEGGSTGRRLFKAALSGGARALGADGAGLARGAPADLVALEDPHGLAPDGDQLIDRWVFGRDVAVRDVWAAGRHLVRDGRHVARARVAARFGAVLRRIMA